MGCFSWMFADKANKKALCMGEPGYLMLPSGAVIATDCYDGYGHFGPNEDVDVYDAVADWNRAYLAAHPDYLIPQYGRIWDEELRSYVDSAPKKISEEPWWPYYSDLSLSHKDIEKAILASDIGITPTNDGTNIRLVFPELTEERRKQLTKDVKKKGEETKVALRNIRRDGGDMVKKLKGSDVSEDEQKDMEDELQKMTDKYVKEIDKAVEEKSKEIMTV